MAPPSKSELPASRMTHMPTVRLAGIARRYPATPEAMRELGRQWQDFAHSVSGGALLASRPVMYGVHSGLFDGDEDEYFSGVEIGANDALPDGLAELKLPPVVASVIDHSGTAGEISHTTSAFLRAGTHQLANPRPFDLIERYGKNFDPQAARGDIQLIIPVES